VALKVHSFAFLHGLRHDPIKTSCDLQWLNPSFLSRFWLRIFVKLLIWSRQVRTQYCHFRSPNHFALGYVICETGKALSKERISRRRTWRHVPISETILCQFQPRHFIKHSSSYIRLIFLYFYIFFVHWPTNAQLIDKLSRYDTIVSSSGSSYLIPWQVTQVRQMQ